MFAVWFAVSGFRFPVSGCRFGPAKLAAPDHYSLWDTSLGFALGYFFRAFFGVSISGSVWGTPLGLALWHSFRVCFGALL